MLSGPANLCACPVPPQRALLEQKQKKKRQEPLMVQANADGRPRSRRARQSEEQAPLVESYLSSSGSTSYQGRACLGVGLGSSLCCDCPSPAPPPPLLPELGVPTGLQPDDSQLHPRQRESGPAAPGPCTCSGIPRLRWPWRVFLEHRLRPRPGAGLSAAPLDRVGPSPVRRQFLLTFESGQVTYPLWAYLLPSEH